MERANGVLQDRLLKAMRIHGIHAIAAANAWLPRFMERHNARFAVVPFDANDAHVPYHGADDHRLRQILSKHYPRKLSPSLTCQFHSTLLQVQPSSGGHGLRGAAVTVLEHFDHSCEVLWRTVSLPHSTLQKPRGAPLEQGRKEITVTRHAPSKSRPRPNHPWKTTRIGKLSPEFIERR